MIFGNITDRQANNPAKITHFAGFENQVKTELKTPEYQRGNNAHNRVEQEQTAILREIFALERKDVTFIEYEFDNKANARAHQN
mgnify:CR=1 FL=1